MNSALNEYNQYRSTEAVNRLAMLSMLFGAGAVLTGFFGMNFGHVFERYLFNPSPDTVGFHLAAIALATVISLSIFLIAVYLVVTNWEDYRHILRASDAPTKRHRWFSLRLNG